MKEVIIVDKDPIAEVRQVQVKKKKVFLGKMVKGDGHKFYEFNKSTLELRVVTPEKNTAVPFIMEKLKPGEVYIPHDPAHVEFKARENCTYIFALNEKNAIKKIIKLFNPPHIKLVDE